MVQVNKKTKFMRRIRLAVELKDAIGFFVYEWQDQNKKWDPYAAHVMVKIADAINTDQTTLSVTCQTRSYDIDLKKLTQTNTSTKVTRKIHCVKSSLLFSIFSFGFDSNQCLFSGEIARRDFHNNNNNKARTRK